MSILRPLARLALVLMAVFVLAITAISSLPHDDSDVRAFLLPPEGCEAPCFLGIRIGISTKEEAIALFESQGGSITSDAGRTYFDDSVEFLWQWNGPGVRFVRSDEPIIVDVIEGKVSRLRIPLRMSLGETWLALGAPLYAAIGTSQNGTPSIGYGGVYTDYQFLISTSPLCPAGPLWRHPAELFYATAQGSLDDRDYSQPSQFPNQSYRMCQIAH
jgi:hypothetical protein